MSRIKALVLAVMLALVVSAGCGQRTSQGVTATQTYSPPVLDADRVTPSPAVSELAVTEATPVPTKRRLPLVELQPLSKKERAAADKAAMAALEAARGGAREMVGVMLRPEELKSARFGEPFRLLDLNERAFRAYRTGDRLADLLASNQDEPGGDKLLYPLLVDDMPAEGTMVADWGGGQWMVEGATGRAGELVNAEEIRSKLSDPDGEVFLVPVFGMGYGQFALVEEWGGQEVVCLQGSSKSYSVPDFISALRESAAAGHEMYGAPPPGVCD